MIGIDTMVRINRIKLIYKTLHSKPQTWNILGKYFLQQYNLTYNSDYFICRCSNTKNLELRKIPLIYQEANTSKENSYYQQRRLAEPKSIWK